MRIFSSLSFNLGPFNSFIISGDDNGDGEGDCGIEELEEHDEEEEEADEAELCEELEDMEEVEEAEDKGEGGDVPP